LGRLTIQTDLSGIGPVKAIKYLHESAFASAVLSKKGMDFTPVDIQVNMIIGQDTWK
jgi:hypothetical protein